MVRSESLVGAVLLAMADVAHPTPMPRPRRRRRNPLGVGPYTSQKRKLPPSVSSRPTVPTAQQHNGAHIVNSLRFSRDTQFSRARQLTALSQRAHTLFGARTHNTQYKLKDYPRRLTVRVLEQREAAPSCRS